MAKVFVKNVRLGQATNSSSSHSIIINSDLPEFLNSDNRSGNFGWEDFLVKSKQYKEMYLAAMLYANLKSHMSPKYADIVINSLFNKDIITNEFEYGIDHQSVPTLPVVKDSYRQDYINFDFFNDLKKYIIDNDSIAIAGGNDNEDEHFDYGGVVDSKYMSLPKDGSKGSVVARKDGNHWVLFNQDTGTKIRLSFEHDEPYVKSKYPELVDIKITDYCPYGCDFCYQGSTTSGKHADQYKLSAIARVLGNMGVFEVALGGGEPTLHPNFGEILNSFKYYGIVPNFTTFTASWLENNKLLKTIEECVGGIALSVNSENDLPKLDKLHEWASKSKFYNKIYVQVIAGVANQKFVEELYKKMSNGYGYRNLTILGYKSWGRALGVAAPEFFDFNTFLSNLPENKYARIGVDTKFVQQFCQSLDESNIPKILYTDKEGVFSMYIDAVKQYISKDSYCYSKFKYKTPYQSDDDPDSLDNVIKTHFPF